MSSTAEGTAAHHTGSATDTPAHASTFPRLLAIRAAEHPNRIALQEKRYGIWQPLTWRQCHERVTALAGGLAELGAAQGHTVALIGANRPEWLLAELAAQTLGAAVVGIDPGEDAARIADIIAATGARIAVVEGQQQVDELTEHGARTGSIEAVVYFEPHGLDNYRHGWLHEFSDLVQRDRTRSGSDPRRFDEDRVEGDQDDPAVRSCGPALSGKPEVVTLSYRDLLTTAAELTAADPRPASTDYLCLRGLHSPAEQMLGVARWLSDGTRLSFAEQPRTQLTDLREIRPDTVCAPPRFWEELLSQVQARTGPRVWAHASWP